MIISSDDNLSLDNLEQQWSAIAARMFQPQKILKPLNVSVCLRDLKKSIFSLELFIKNKQISVRNNAKLKIYTTDEILLLWQELIRNPERQNHPMTLRKLVKEIISLSIQKLISDPAIIQLIQNNPAEFYTPLWLRRFYFFFFNDLYLKQNISLLNAWAVILAKCCQSLIQDGNLIRNGSIRLRYVSLVKTIELSTSDAEGFQVASFESYLSDLLRQAPEAALQRIESLEHYFRDALGFDVLPDGIRLYCQQHLFSLYLAHYLANQEDIVSLNNLLEQFCQLDNKMGQDHLIRLIKEAYGQPSALRNLTLSIKGCIKAFLLRTIKDPRLNNAAWGSLKDRNKAIYDGLRYWFVEADFNLFFDFAFRHSRDDHHRKDLWIKFLKQAHDFRVFLPPASHREFRATLTEENRHAQVYENSDNITGFILCIDNLIIYEAVETGNAAYVYDQAELETLKIPEAKKVIRFLNTLFIKNEMSVMGSREALAHTRLAPLPTDWTKNTKSRRFTHDRHGLWHHDVLNYLRSQHFIVPDSQG